MDRGLCSVFFVFTFMDAINTTPASMRRCPNTQCADDDDDDNVDDDDYKRFPIPVFWNCVGMMLMRLIRCIVEQQNKNLDFYGIFS